MKQSESITELVKALSAFQGAMKSVPKAKTNSYFNSKYADLDAIWDTCREPLKDNGFSLVQTTDSDPDGNLFLETTLFHNSGEYMVSVYPITPMRQVKDVGWEASGDPQSLGSAITYARRYAMSAMLGISAEDDDDAEGAMNRENKTPVQRPTRQASAARPALDPNSPYYCAEHKVMRFKTEKMKNYAHPIGDTGNWCNQPKVVDGKPGIVILGESEEAKESAPDDQQETSQPELVEALGLHPAEPPTAQPFKNLGELYTAAANGERGLRGGLSRDAVLAATGYLTHVELNNDLQADAINLEQIWDKVMEQHGAEGK